MPMLARYLPDNPDNPYQSLFARAMADHGIVYEPARHWGEVFADPPPDAVHLHWTEWLTGEGGNADRLRQVRKLRHQLLRGRRRGVRIIWTVHNHHRHRDPKSADALEHLLLARHADLLIAHSHWSMGYLQRRYRPRGEAVVMPHGNYEHCYHPVTPPLQTRQAFGLDPDRPVLGMVGSMNRYRGCERALQAVRQMEPGVQLLLIGSASDPAYPEQLRTAAGDRAGVVIEPGRVDEARFAEAVRACDVVLLPYQEITGSGALLSAWTLGRSVVTSDLPFFREYVRGARDSAAGRVASDDTPRGLAAAAADLLAVDPARREAAALAEAGRYGWPRVVEPVARVMLEWHRLSGG